MLHDGREEYLTRQGWHSPNDECLYGASPRGEKLVDVDRGIPVLALSLSYSDYFLHYHCFKRDGWGFGCCVRVGKWLANRKVVG